MPGWIQPMLATLTRRRFSDPNWIFERKFDGQRLLAFSSAKSTRLMSRNRKDVSTAYPELVDAFRRLPHADLIVDGEVVAFDGSRTSFERLQQRMQIRSEHDARLSRVPVYFYLFDVLYLDGKDLTALPLLERKRFLRHALPFEDPIRMTVHRVGEGETYYREACSKGWEGVIAKRADSSYQGGRSMDWLKFKCAQGQELVIGGFTEPQGSAQGLGALLVGYYAGDRFKYAGKVGTGFTVDVRLRLRARLDRLVRKNCPFDEDPRESGATWVAPRLVAEFAFSEWTRDGKLRHPSFRGLRDDRSPAQVVRETPVP